MMRMGGTAVAAAGGAELGDVVKMTTKDGRHITWCYVTDPAGNILSVLQQP